MQQFLVIVCCLIILSVCVMGAFGFWHFVNSDTAEAQVWRIVDGVSEGIVLLGQGVFVVLVALAIGVFLFLAGKGLQAGSEAAGKGVATYMLAKRAAELMAPNSSVETPDIRIFPLSQLVIPAELIVGGDQVCLPAPGSQTDQAFAQNRYVDVSKS